MKLGCDDRAIAFQIKAIKYNPKTMRCELAEAVVSRDWVLDQLIRTNIVGINIHKSKDNRIYWEDPRGIVRDRKLLEKIAKIVRSLMEAMYGTGTDLCGHCIEASELICEALKTFGASNAKTVEGWCCFDDESYGSDRPWDEHTWVEIGDIYVDVTADQFNPGMYKENEFEPIVIRKGLPYCMTREEPTWDDYE